MLMRPTRSGEPRPQTHAHLCRLHVAQDPLVEGFWSAAQAAVNTAGLQVDSGDVAGPCPSANSAAPLQQVSRVRFAKRS